MRAARRRQREFWDQAAQANAMWYVDTSLSYEQPDPGAFQANGRRIAEIGLEHFRPDRGRHVCLEIGCGTGRVVDALAPSFRFVVGVDVSSEMLRRAGGADGPSNRAFVQSDGTGLACLRDGSVDFVLSFAVFTHLRSARWIGAYFDEVGRVLAPGGHAALHVNSSSGSLRWAARRRLLSLWSRAVRRTERGRSSPYFQGSAVSVSRVRGFMARAGLEEVEVRHPGTLFTLVYARKASPGPSASARDGG